MVVAPASGSEAAPPGPLHPPPRETTNPTPSKSSQDPLNHLVIHLGSWGWGLRLRLVGSGDGLSGGRASGRVVAQSEYWPPLHFGRVPRCSGPPPSWICLC